MQIRDLIPWGRQKQEAAPAAGHDDTGPVTSLQRDINRVFDEFWTRFERPFGMAGPLGRFGPSTDVSESDREVEISVELPGLDEKDIEVSLTGDMLTISGEKKDEREETRKGYYLSERSYGAFHRSVPLPAGVDPDRAQARFKRGVLTVTLPKTAEAQARTRRIDVKAS